MTWPMVALADVLRASNDRVTLAPDTRYKQVTARLWGKGLALRGEVTGAEIAASQQNQVRTGQFVISKIDARHGAFGVVPPELDGAVVSNDFPVFDVRSQIAKTSYIAWVSRADWFIALCKQASEGSTNRVRLKEARFLAQCIPLPPLGEQQRIVARLDTAAVAAGHAEKLMGEVDHDLLQAARNIIWRAGKDPKSWVPCSAFLHRRPLDVRVEADVEYAFAGVYSFGRGVFRSEVKRGSTFSYPALTRIRAGDFTYPKLMAWEGALGVVQTDCDGLVVSPEFPVFEIDAAIVQPAVVDTFFRDPRTLPMLRSASSGTNMRRRRIQPGQFLDLKMPLPSADEQTMLTTILKRRNAVLEARRDSIAAIQGLLPAMLSECLGTGT